MIVVRSLAEAAVYAHLTGHAVLTKRSPRPTAHVWECMWRDEARQLIFVEDPSEGASRLIQAPAFAQVGAEFLATVPATPLGFVREEAKRCVHDLVLAAYCFSEALAFGDDPTLRTALEASNVRRSTWVAALPGLPGARPAPDIPLPPHGFVPPEAIARWFARPVPFPITDIPDELAVVARVEDGRFLARHAAHSLAWLTVSEARMVTRIEALEGRAALDALLQNGFQLLEVQKARLRACGQPGDTLADMLTQGLGEGRHRAILELQSGGDRVRFLEIETRDPRLRGALLAVRIDSAERILGWRLVEGADGYEMLGLLDATAPHLPGPAGERPVAESASTVAGALQVVGESVRPVLEAMLDLGRAGEVIASLRPRPGDAARVFVGGTERIAAIDARYQELWDKDPPRVRAPSREVQLQIYVATAGMLSPSAEMDVPWPRSYAGIADGLVPSRTWVAWAYVPTAGGRSTDYDGLVWIDDHWAWFAAPWRVLAR